MVRPSTGIVAVPDLPEDYELRQYLPDDEVAYRDLFKLGFVDDRLEHTLDHALGEGFFVAVHTVSGQIAASCVAERGSWDGGHGRGILGWLIVDPSHARLGLGTTVAAKVTNRLVEEGYVEPGLGTEDFRLPAIGIYLKLGWRPFLYMEDMEHRWRETCERLGRRFLRQECVEP